MNLTSPGPFWRGGGEGDAKLDALGCKWEEVGASLALDERGDRFAIPLLQHRVCVDSVIL